jgi:hypothetical protein
MIIFMSTKVRSAPVGQAEEIQHYLNVAEGIKGIAIKILDVLKTYPNEFTQINYTLLELVPKASNHLIIIFTMLLWTGTLALNTLPSLKDSISDGIYSNLAPYIVGIITTLSAILSGAAGTSVYNCLSALDDRAKWGLLATSILWFFVSCFKSRWWLSVVDSLERPFGVTTRWGTIKYWFVSCWAKKLFIFKKIILSHNLWFLIISLILVFGINFGVSNPTDGLPLSHKDLPLPHNDLLPRDIPCNVSPDNHNIHYVHILVWIASAIALGYFGLNMEQINQVSEQTNIV